MNNHPFTDSRSTFSNLSRQLTISALLLAFSLFANAANANAPVRVLGEPAKASALKSKIASDESFVRNFEATAPTVSFFAMDPDRIEQAKISNVSKFRKATQIGITQSIRDEAFDAPSVALNWKSSSAGTLVAHFKARSPGALATRVALVTSGLPAGSELRFAGSDAPFRVVHVATPNEFTTLLDDAGRYWTPMTDGDTQLIEVHLPLGESTRGIGVSIEAISHMFASVSNGFKAATQLKGHSAGACNVDAICPTQTAGYVGAKNAVAHMVYQAGCGFLGALGSCICTGTLLNDTVTATQMPYFYSASHCLSTQTQAFTLETYWNYDNPVCRGADIARSQSNVLRGGATLLYANEPTDVLLLQLTPSPGTAVPVTAFFSGWDLTTIAGSTAVTIIHHPQGDPKKVTLGQTLANPFTVLSDMGNSSYITPTYTSGVTEPGSSGSGVFSISNGNYFLRGGLLGGPSTCATAGDITNPLNRDYYSRFDLAYPILKQWLDPTPTTLLPLSRRGGIDLDGNNRSVLLISSTAGLTQAGRLVNNVFQWSSSTSLNPGQNYRSLGAVDFAGTGRSDLAVLETSALNGLGQGDARLYRNFNIASGGSSLRLVKSTWDVQVVGDLDGDGFGDLVWRFLGITPNFDDQGVSYIWFTDGTGVNQVRKRGGAPLTWKLLGAADLNGDNAADMVYVSPANAVRVLMATPARTCANLSGGTLAAGSTAIKMADFTGNRRGDILTRNATTGEVQIVVLNATGLTLPAYTGLPDDPNASCTSSSLSVTQTATYAFNSTPSWTIFATGDFNGDGIFDIVFMQPDRTLTLWQMNANGAAPTVFNAGSAPANFTPFPLQ